MGTFTSKRLNYNEMMTLLNMLGISTGMLSDAKDHGESATGAFTIRKTPLEGLYTLAFALETRMGD